MTKRVDNRKRPTAQEVEGRMIERLKRFSEYLESGEPICDAYSCRKVILDLRLEPYTPDLVKETRQKMKLSQSLFARFLNVSTSLVQKWERGETVPSGTASRLLDEIRFHPDYWRERFRSMVKMVKVPS